jgi:hypothetical protein
MFITFSVELLTTVQVTEVKPVALSVIDILDIDIKMTLG